ncbi:30S ribosomal protein S5 [candidate division WWE3 bacterium CG06_land_8_20_14_3_00_42_16]|uniref:Small ribosomal subunit protein uS5 n=4 Tax=Katanobacteria TaxID=422282 RepID=A0A2M7AMQ3_UNCKA|nr:MAG: 30S ribosomal protein S5 [bacterium CG1_02_42_9]PIU68655.1 MAG: 30S ribosomal protein S5 [candidate division WWE3 bacterium CG06_land_8_20_14_3_00_42_16]PIZ42990.1 MAG: 30S ribosomal protein S5 [candidate division WWE3 bacterium CG_4_10_14_0_2_um_filter_42_8]PJA37998.1 MAG: 30S ribosomal protein S5 [candidate division WWE3 bacterium CG_4_9_14_3_um_filter_43_9]PJC69376.1 MAG: 30S ribosomal protein S5 [candidate division WWE3 bacterium CG_4_8_14_3_um_filter_42_11]
MEQKFQKRTYQEKTEKEFTEKVVQVNRVSKKTKGGNRISFSVIMVVGDGKGRVGVGLGKAADVAGAIRKGSTYAKKHLIKIPMVAKTIPHEIKIKRGAAKIILRPAAPGTGVIAGGAVRAVVEAAGIKDILSKVLGTSNQASNVYATFKAFQTIIFQEEIYRARSKKNIEPPKKIDSEKEEKTKFIKKES